MKKNQDKLLFKKTAMLFLMMVLFIACDKDDDAPTNPVDLLPPATQTGAGTFGCLVNGVPFVDNSGFFNCFYQLVNEEYYFGIRGRQESYIRQIGVGSEKKDINVGVPQTLKSQQDGNFYGRISFNCFNCLGATTLDGNPGMITFTKLDFENNIISATFEFTVNDPNTGTIYEITEGRFDSFFTQ
ncbi:MAG: hypothetical protein ACOVOQ_07400 [Flavobacterium sp.]